MDYHILYGERRKSLGLKGEKINSLPSVKIKHLAK
jgi:hypothetical protein